MIEIFYRGVLTAAIFGVGLGVAHGLGLSGWVGAGFMFSVGVLAWAVADHLATP